MDKICDIYEDIEKIPTQYEDRVVALPTNYRKDFEDEKEKEINARKTNTLEQLIQFYPNCAQIIINSKPKQ